MNELSSLVNPEKIRESIRRTFTGTPAEILGELLQNSQRAGATDVKIATVDPIYPCVTFEDNGTGLSDVQGFHTLLRMADSSYKSDVEAQNPMGLGIHSLLASDEVQRVIFRSGYLSLEIDTARWWSDYNYCQTWFERMNVEELFVKGLHIEVRCDQHFADVVRVELGDEKFHDEWKSGYRTSIYSEGAKSPPYNLGRVARGYQGVLNIMLNGLILDTSASDNYKQKNYLFAFDYMGCLVKVGFHNSFEPHGFGVVNWYGQEIHNSSLDFGGFQVTLEVRGTLPFGRPVNPKAPTRDGLIADKALEAFKNYVWNEIYRYIANPVHSATVLARPSMVQSLYRTSSNWANLYCPYFVAAEWNVVDDLGAVEEDGSPDRMHSMEVFRYADTPQMLSDKILIDRGDNGMEEARWGVSSFVPQFKSKVYKIISGNYSKLKEIQLVWKPVEVDGFFAEKPGQFRFDFTGEYGNGPQIWFGIEEDATVFAIIDRTSGTLEGAEAAIYTPNKLDFLTDEIRILFHSGQYDYDSEFDAFWEEVAALRRSLIGNAVSASATREEIMSQMDKKDSPIVSVFYHYSQGWRQELETIIATNGAGQIKTLKVVA